MRSNRRLRWAIIPIAVVISLVLAGCTQQQLVGFLPTTPGTTNHVDRVIGLWNTSWIVLLVVGVVTWGLILWAAIVYRRRKGQVGLPVQLRYNLPIEIFYTVVPLILVLGFFAFTARDQNEIEKPMADPQVKIEVYGQRWAWTFNYLDEQVYSAGVQASVKEDGGLAAPLNVLHLPVGKRVQIDIKSRDVAHSFWIVNFLYKKDMIPGKTNYMYFIPEKIGTYQGKCAELCGQYHSLMLFQVKVESQSDYDAYIAQQKAAGFTGTLGDAYNPNSNLPGTGAPKG
ncbi:MAG: cytochrome c oxidase subunit [Actinomycetota bacterium]|nr:cytochrome c oxidase subunit [Actinomycetota bacterium]